MAILKNVAVYYVKCDPKRPNAQFSPDNPRWEVQCITTDPAQKDEWVGLGLPAKLMKYKEGHEKEGEPILNDAGKKQWKMSLTKNSLKKEKVGAETKLSPSSPVDVIDGNRTPVNPNTIANGSICNVRVYLYEYPSKKKPGTIAIGHVLMGIQLLTHIVYTAKPREEFEQAETIRIVPQSEDSDEEDGVESDDIPFKGTPGAPKVTPKDNLPESKF